MCISVSLCAQSSAILVEVTEQRNFSVFKMIQLSNEDKNTLC